MSEQAGTSPFVFVVRVPMPTNHAARTAVQVLQVDTSFPQTTMLVEDEGHQVVIKLQSASARALRTAVHAALEQLNLVVRTIEAFAPLPSRGS